MAHMREIILNAVRYCILNLATIMPEPFTFVMSCLSDRILRLPISQLNFHLSQFNDIVNTVRYEKPLYLILTTDNWNGSISTNLEPVGEEEP